MADQPVFFMAPLSCLEGGFQQEGHITCMSSSDVIIDHGKDLSGNGAGNLSPNRREISWKSMTSLSKSAPILGLNIFELNREDDLQFCFCRRPASQFILCWVLPTSLKFRFPSNHRNIEIRRELRCLDPEPIFHLLRYILSLLEYLRYIQAPVWV